ncbi:hypothetical protein PHYSODRAFT_344380 [Phytophthora sojae]|uniref:FYVE-type domain-containing protein n=1 Tax=Phytophthora sojae (strain P6497) TaxID=1094619 RepID=G4YU03_PHYSP|nr:hypothetical protein PHYSODRAFT_344380 [Phytophthora sojae]EGZ23081.1 hypothetical protein PHYSODRAFT_344380 [Phytophthora sojae]|eukprot:XP_009518369.1 hypothetical protein PHYSODRAFT_344380 [Phytophthora sojae]
MSSKRLTVNPFEELALTAEDREKLVGIADTLVLANFEKYKEHLSNDKRVDLTRWKKHATSGATTTYLEKKSSNPDSKFPELLMVGPLPGTLDENMVGLMSPTLESMRINAAAVLDSVVEPTVEEPFRSVVVKWMEFDIPGASIGIARNCDYVYLEIVICFHMGKKASAALVAVRDAIALRKFPPELQLPEKKKDSLFSSWHGHPTLAWAPECLRTSRVPKCVVEGCLCEPKVKEYLQRGIMDPGGDMIRSVAVMGMVQATMAGVKYSYCGQMKKLAWLLEQKHARVRERGAPEVGTTCVTCSKPIKSSKLGKTNTTCKLCFGALCGSCKVAKKLSFITLDLQLSKRKVDFCVKCLVKANQMDTLEAARQQFVHKEPVELPPNCGTLLTSTMSVSSDSSS